jgi:hypothetical protein
MLSAGPDQLYGNDDDVTNWDDSLTDSYNGLGEND